MQQSNVDTKPVLELKYIPKKKQFNKISLISNKNNFILFFQGENIKDYFLAKEIKPYFLDPLLENIKKNHNLHLKPYESAIISGLDKTFLNELFSNPELYKYLHNFSKEYLTELSKKISSFDINKMDVFLKNMEYNIKFNSKANLLLDVKRIEAGLLTNKVISKKFYSACSETYDGFLRAIKSGTAGYFKIGSKNYLVKSHIGYDSFITKGYNTLALDLSNFDVYTFGNLKNGKPDFMAKKYDKNTFLTYKSAKYFKKILARQSTSQQAIDVIDTIKEIKKNLQKHVAQAYSKQNLEHLRKSMKEEIKKKSHLFNKNRFKK